MQHTIEQELKGVVGFVAAMWGVFLLDMVLPLDLRAWGLIPRTVEGLPGIATMPFLHANWQHLIGNTAPVFVLLVLLAGSRANSWGVVVQIVLGGGLLLWLCGRPAVHIGASGLICGLIVFLIVSGWLERRFVPLAISVGVSFFYGGSLLLGVIPRFGSQVSWDGHLCGAVAGGIVAFLLARRVALRAGTTETVGGSGALPEGRRGSGWWRRSGYK